MNGRRNHKSANSELPIPARGPDTQTPEARIELAPAPDIDIAQDHLGILFTERRRALGMKIEEIAEDIKVKADYLRAIEQEKFDLLPTPEYARLFIKAYAERLGFSLPEVFALLDVSASLAPPEAKPKVVGLQAEPSRRSSPPSPATVAVEGTRQRPLVIWGVVAAALVALGVVALVVLSAGKSKPQSAATPAQSTASIPVIPMPQSVPDEGVDSLPITDGAVTVEQMNLVLQFARDTWVSLDMDHDNVVNRIVRAGERVEASAEESFVLSVGHTDGVTATMNGRTIDPFSTWTRRLNRYLITRDSVHAWFGAGRTDSSGPTPNNSLQGVADTGGAGH